MRRLMSSLICMSLCFSFVPVSNAYYSDQFMGEYLLNSYKKMISMDLQNASLVDVLKVLSRQTGISFVSSDGVSDRTLTLYLDKVPLKDAMDTIFLANNLEYEFFPESNIFIIKEALVPETRLLTKIYKLRYASVSNSNIEKVKEEMSGSSDSRGSDDDEDEGLLAAVTSVLSEYGSVQEDPRTNSLIVRDIEKAFPEIERIIAELDVPVPKVLIEVEIVDVSKATGDKLGVYFGNGLSLSAALQGATRTTSFPWSMGDFPGRPSSDRMYVTETTTASEGEAVTESVSDIFPKSYMELGSLSFGQLSAVLQLLRQDGKTKFLARPRIMTLSGETAEINLTSNEAITASATTTTDTGQTVTTWSIEREDVGTMLKVTPQATVIDDEVLLVIEPTVSNAVADAQFTTNNNIANKVQRRSSRSVVRVGNNETLMIGGLLKKVDSESFTKVPFLGDIPLLGNLFKHTNRSQEDRELLVFLTPRIIKEDKESIYSEPVVYGALEREQSFGKRGENIQKALARFE